MSAHTPGPWGLVTVPTTVGSRHKIGPFPSGRPDGTRRTVAFGDMNSAAGIALLNAMVRDLTTSPQKGSTDE